MKIYIIFILIIFICSCYSPYEKLPDWCKQCTSEHCCHSIDGPSRCISVCKEGCNIKVECE